MKNYLLGISLFGFLIASAQAAPEAPPAQSPSSSPTPVAMKEFTYKDTGMGFSMPGEPRLFTHTVNTAACPITVTRYLYNSQGSDLMVMVNTFAQNIPDPGKYLQQARDGAVKDYNARLIAQKDITIDGYRGVEFKFEGDKYQGTYRMYVAGTRLYQVGSFYPIHTSQLPATDQFYASFHLLMQ